MHIYIRDKRDHTSDSTGGVVGSRKNFGRPYTKLLHALLNTDGDDDGGGGGGDLEIGGTMTTNTAPGNEKVANSG